MELEKRIDTHVHYLPPAYEAMLDRRNLTTLDGGFPRPKWSEEALFQQMDEMNILYSLLSISSPHLHMGDTQEAIETAGRCNEYGAELGNRYPDKIGIMASLPLPEVEASIAEVRACQKQSSVKGFALLTNSCGIYLGDPLLDPVMEVLDEIHAVVSLHPGMPAAVPEGIHERLPYPFMEFFFDTTRTVANMILHGIPKRYPNIRFVIPHAGAFVPILSDRLATLPVICPEMKDIDVMGDLSAFYYDLAGISMPKQYDVLRKITDDSHLLYGSDAPFTPASMCKKLAADMDQKLGEERVDQVYLKNPEKLFGEHILHPLI